MRPQCVCTYLWLHARYLETPNSSYVEVGRNKLDPKFLKYQMNWIQMCYFVSQICGHVHQLVPKVSGLHQLVTRNCLILEELLD